MKEEKHPLDSWDFCPRCGSSRFEVHDFKSKKCAHCGFEYYFNPAAATAAFVLNERGELLVCRRAKEPARGTLDLPGGFCDCYETGEESVLREIYEETGLRLSDPVYLFSLPNIYPYSGFRVHTVDMFFRLRVADAAVLRPMDDVAACFWQPLDTLHPEDFGLGSVRRAVERALRLGCLSEKSGQPAEI